MNSTGESAYYFTDEVLLVRLSSRFFSKSAGEKLAGAPPAGTGSLAVHKIEFNKSRRCSGNAQLWCRSQPVNPTLRPSLPRSKAHAKIGRAHV